jgi:prepilin-type N-terminal cleavage/methylation domain-containing protein
MRARLANPVPGHGFTLTELAVVLVIVALLIGGLLMPLAAQDNVRRTQDTQKTLGDVREALLGFAAANGRLPCPAIVATNGQESFSAGGSAVNGSCSNYYDGFLPAALLGLAPINPNGMLLDGWGQPIRYAVASANSNAATKLDGIKNVSLATYQADLRVCARAPEAAAVLAGMCAIPETTNLLTNSAVAVIYSLGANAARGGTGADERHNPSGIPPGNPYYVAPDRVFVSHEPAPATAVYGEFDDVVVWLSPNILFNRMIAAGRLP